MSIFTPGLVTEHDWKSCRKSPQFCLTSRLSVGSSAAGWSRLREITTALRRWPEGQLYPNGTAGFRPWRGLDPNRTPTQGFRPGL